MEFNFDNILIFGYGTSGKSVEKILKDKKISYKVYDDNNNLNGGIYLYSLNRKTLKMFDLIVLSPGVSIYHSKIKLAKKMNIKVISELEFGAYFCKKEIIAVTGTNGKTTTVTLLNHIFNACGVNVELLGNVGTPFSETYFSKSDVSIVEVSSFQLEAIEYFHPHIAVLLNVASDHIDRHKTYQNYVKAKYELFKNLNISDFSILPNDERLSFESIKGTQFFISKSIKIVNDEIHLFIDDEDIFVCDISIFIGINVFMENILNCILVSFLYGLNLKDVVDSILTFKPLQSRLEIVKEQDGVFFVNDSKATNIHAMQNAISQFKNDSIYLLLCGYDKKLDFMEFCNNVPNNIVKVVLFGPLGKRLKKCFNKVHYENYVKFDKLLQAIEYCKSYAKSGDIVLLSPASSSFDEFSNYRERGEFFVKNI